jgi:Flp pilus assembly protein CpaB
MYNSMTGRLATSRGGAVLLGILAALIAAILLTVYITHYRSSVKGDAAPASVLEAKRLIPAGTTGAEIGSKQLYRLASVPKDRLVAGAITDPAGLNGVITSRDIFPGQQISSNDVTTSETASAGVLSAELKAGQRAVLVQVDALDANLNNLRAGDHVDIYQQITSSNDTVVKLFRANVPILQVTATGTTEEGNAAGQIVLEVPARDSADFLFAAKHTQLSFVLRPAAGATQTPAASANTQTMLQFSRTH